MGVGHTSWLSLCVDQWHHSWAMTFGSETLITTAFRKSAQP